MYKNECKHVMIESYTNRYIKIWHENPCTWFMYKLDLCSHDTIQRCQVCVHMWTRMPWLWICLIKSCGTLKLLPLTWWIYVHDFDVLSCEKIGSDLAATSAGISSKSWCKGNFYDTLPISNGSFVEGVFFNCLLSYIPGSGWEPAAPLPEEVRKQFIYTSTFSVSSFGLKHCYEEPKEWYQI